MFTLQLEWIQSLQKIRSPALDHLIKLFDFFDRPEFFFILIPIIWLNYSWRLGIKIFYLFALSHFVNYSLKNIFALPRPFHMDPNVGLIQISGYGFPSGAAQTAILLSSLLVLYWNNRWKWLIAAGFVLCLSFSRVYLGLHFPIDILGGWVVGFFLLGIFLLFFPKVEQFLKHRSTVTALFLQYFLLLIILLTFPSKMMKNICVCAMGLGTGIFTNQLTNTHLSPSKTKLEFWTRSVIGLLGIFLMYFFGLKEFNLQSPIGLFFLFLSIGLWISLVAFRICKKLSFSFLK